MRLLMEKQGFAVTWQHVVYTASLAALASAFAGALASALTIESANAAEAVIYKTIAADGTVVFTDQKEPDATVVKPSPLNIIKAPDSSSRANKTVNTAAGTRPAATGVEPVDPAPVTITEVQLITPINDQTLIDPQLPFVVQIETRPATTIPEQLVAQLILDGKVVASAQNTQLPLNSLERGTHSLQVQIIDDQGRIKAESGSVEIHVRKTLVAGSSQ